MFLLLASLCTSENYYPCDQGVIQYNGEEFEQNHTVPEWKGKWDHTSKGVFCPPQSGNYYFDYRGRINTIFKFRGESWRSGDGFFQSCDLVVRGDTKGPFPMTYGKCEYFEITNLVRCSVDGSPWHELKYRLNNEGDWQSMTTVARCLQDDCIRTRYGSNCQIECDSYCHGNGVCDWGMTSKGFCRCDRFGSDRFCEDVSKVQNMGYRPGEVVVRKYDSPEDMSSDTLSSEFSSPFSYLSSFRESYKSVEVSFQVLLPQNGDYQFRVVSDIGVAWTQDGQSHGTVGDMFSCESGSGNGSGSGSYTSSGNVFHSTRRLMGMRLRFNSGCSLYGHWVRLEWRNGRYYAGISNAPWETFPTRYIYSTVRN